MTDKNKIASRFLSEIASCHFFNFGLIVTGETEELHLPKIFRSLMKSGICNFSVIRRIGQRSPIISEKKKLKMVGNGKIIPDKDQEEIGLPARRYLSANVCRFVLLIDDLEPDRREIEQQIYDRYRLAFDTILMEYQKRKAAVHFLVPMLEAYYFADAKAINSVLKIAPPLDDYDGDVESKRNPKAEFKELYPGFNEKEDSGKILETVDFEHVLSRSNTCASLRTLFNWCIKVLEHHPNYESLSLGKRYSLNNGIFSEITKRQFELLSS